MNVKNNKIEYDAVVEGVKNKKNEKPTPLPLNKEEVISALKTVYDPEISVNIYDLGLIYEILIKTDNTVFIDMTLTSPTCPVADTLPKEIARAVANKTNAINVYVKIVWEPIWNINMMSEEAKYQLDLTDFQDLDIDFNDSEF